MKSMITPLLLFSFFLISSVSYSQETKRYYSMDYMKVAPENIQDYLACEKAWKKIHLHKKEKGDILGWALKRVVSPAGSSTEYNFVTRQSFKDVKQLAAYQNNSYMPDDWESLLTPEEVALVKKTTMLRTWVKNEVWSAEERVLAEDMSNADISVMNFFTMPEGVRRSEHFEVERKYWMPYHEQRVKNGTMKGWVLLDRELPMGSDHGASVATVDIYTDMFQFWEPWDEAAFAKMHPNTTFEKIWEETMAVSIRGLAEVRKAIDSTSR